MKFLLPITFSLLIGAAMAQNSPTPPSPQSQQSGGRSVTITGCLTKGSVEGQYSITDSKTGQKINFTDAEPMDSYLNHTVQVTGTMSGDSSSSDKTFTPQTIKTIADSCSGSGQK